MSIEGRCSSKLAVVSLLAAATACGGGAADGGGGWAGSIRDSAGISIVSNPERGLWTDADRWTLTEELRIGTAAGDADYQFGQISGIAELQDGRLLVMDQQAQHLRLFSAEGVFERTIGGPGSGPGEFGIGAGPVLVGPGDSIYVPDLLNRRLNHYTPDAELVGSSIVDVSTGFPALWLDTPEGRLFNQLRPIPVEGQATEPLDLILERGSDGLVIDTLRTFPSGRTFQMRDGVPDFTFFAPEPVWTLGTDGSFVYGYNDTYRFEVSDGSGVVRIIEKAFQPRPVADADRDVMSDGMMRTFEDFGMGEAQLAVFRDAIGFADAYPAYIGIRGGPEGSLMVQHVQLPSELPPEELENYNPTLGLGSPRWDVFDPEGRFLGELEMPRRYQPIRIEGNRIYGIWRDELDIQHVMVMRVDWDAAQLETGG